MRNSEKRTSDSHKNINIGSMRMRKIYEIWSKNDLCRSVIILKIKVKFDQILVECNESYRMYSSKANTVISLTFYRKYDQNEQKREKSFFQQIQKSNSKISDKMEKVNLNH